MQPKVGGIFFDGHFVKRIWPFWSDPPLNKPLPLGKGHGFTTQGLQGESLKARFCRGEETVESTVAPKAHGGILGWGLVILVLGIAGIGEVKKPDLVERLENDREMCTRLRGGEAYIRAVGNDFPEEDVPVGIEGVDDDVQHLGHIALEIMFLLCHVPGQGCKGENENNKAPPKQRHAGGWP